jgi:Zn-dependent protease
MHEFGHALACRQVGGRADTIMLWPLGGVAYVVPPPRPGAMLWSIAAGPLVNAVLVPVTIGLYYLAEKVGWTGMSPDLGKFLWFVAFWINLPLFIFNLIPIYPLDGGQILYALLWFIVGRVRGLRIASVVGIIGGLVALLLAVRSGYWWLGLIAVFIILRANVGLQQARSAAA